MPIRFHVNRSCLRAFAPFVWAPENQPALRGVRCEVSEENVVLVATDGAKLLALRIPVAPAVESEPGDFTIPAELFKHLPEVDHEDEIILGLAPAKPENACRGLVVEAEGEQVSIIGKWTVAGAAPSAHYPDWRKVVPAEPTAPDDPAAAPRFIAENLAAFCEAARRMHIVGTIEVYPAGEEAAALVFFPEVPEMVGMVMPMRKNEGEPEMSVPGWARTGEAYEREGDEERGESQPPQPRRRT